MSLLTISAVDPETIAVGASSAAFSATLDPERAYALVSSTACYVKQGAPTPTAVAGAGASLYVAPNTVVQLHGRNGPKLAVIQASAGGFASLAKLQWH